MRRNLAPQLLLALSVVLVLPVAGQVSLGTPRYASTSGGPDQINLSNLNMQLTIPIVQRAGRGIDFGYSMVYNSAFYNVVAGSNGSGLQWKPQSSSMGWGAGGSSTPSAYVAPTSIQTTGCPGQTGGTQLGVLQYTNFIFVDRKGVLHPFAGTVYYGAAGCPGITGYPTFPNGYTSLTNVGSPDHSGILLSTVETTPPQGGYSLQFQITMPDGSTSMYPFNYQEVPAEPLPYTGDNNGNFITPSGNPVISLIPGSTGTGPSFYQWSVQGGGYTDTLGNTALSVGPETLGPDGAVSIFGTVTYPYGQNQTASVVPHYANYTIQTNFGCSGIAEYQPSTGALLLSGLTLADGRQYGFTYEPGPGTTSTGRIASITLPSGGTITYAYTKVNGSSINCSTGAPVGFTRTVNDGRGNSYTSTYTWAQAPSPLTNTTTVTDPAGPPSSTVLLQLLEGWVPLSMVKSWSRPPL